MKTAEHTLVFAGGGTGGHVYPALAVAEVLESLNGACRIHFVGTASGIEARVVPDAGYPFVAVPAKGARGKPWRDQLGAMASLWNGVRASWGILGALRPHVVVATSGYASLPVAIAAWCRRIPVIVLEQNVQPGWSTRMLRPLAARIVTTFEVPASAGGMSGKKIVALGNPVRQAALTGDRASGRKRLGIPFRAMVMVVMGGSQGARSLNDMVLEALPEVFKRVPGAWVMWCTGADDESRVRLAVQQRAWPSVLVTAYEERMGEVYASADMVVSRAGGSAVAEIAAWGLPAVFVPLERAGGGHQLGNAAWMADHGAAVLVREGQRAGRELSDAVVPLLAPSGIRDTMAACSRAVAKPDAARAIAELIQTLWGPGRALPSGHAGSIASC